MLSYFKALCIFLCICVFIITTTTNVILPSYGSTSREKLGIQPIGSSSNDVPGDIAFDDNTYSLNVHDFNVTKQTDPWIANIPTNGEGRRKVLFVELHKWEDYYGPSKYKTGEYYVSATWDYALRKNGFRVDRVSTRHYYERMSSKDILSYHRIFVRDPRWHRFYGQRDIFCKVRPMYFYGDWYFGKNNDNYRFHVPFDERQILSAYIDDRNTFMGYFPHNLLNQTELPNAERERKGLLYGKKPEYFEGYDELIHALMNAGFELHTTCKDSPDKKCSFPPGVIRHGAMKPDEYADLMTNFSFMLGFKKPEGSPSPLVGMTFGVAFLNPLREENGMWPQHKAMSRIGFPYTYVVDLENITSVIQAAEWSHKHRFASFVPPSYRVESLVSRMRRLLEDDSFCTCSKDFFPNHQQWKKIKNHA